jgi:SDR family mycofactocin-dependent oxidoreductase
MGIFDGRVAFITGAARGQGRAHAVRLAQGGADIVATDICEQIPGVPYPMSTEADLKETARLVEETGQRAHTAIADVRDLSQVRSSFDAGVEAFGHIDIVLANAGVILTGAKEGDEAAMFKMGIDVMLTGVWNTFQVAIPHLIEKGNGGSIIATSSVAGLKAFTDGHGGSDSYTCAKTAIVSLVKAYAGFLGSHNIRVNAIAPTGVATAMVVENPGLIEVIMAHPHLQGAMTNALPVEMLQPEDVSAVVAFLASDEARYITGSTIAVDAGSMSL